MTWKMEAQGYGKGGMESTRGVGMSYGSDGFPALIYHGVAKKVFHSRASAGGTIDTLKKSSRFTLPFSDLSSPRSASDVSFNSACKAPASERTLIMTGLCFRLAAIKKIGFEFQDVEQRHCEFLPLPYGALEHLSQVVVFVIAFPEQDMLCRELLPVPCSIVVPLA